jgi:predicted lipoprotein with Yx(FWY)xxD motif
MIRTLLRASAGLAAAFALAASAHAATMLTAANGMTLYTFAKDMGGKPSCYAACAKNWPPYFAKKGEKMSKGWTEVARKGGKMQWAYDGKPVYFYAADKKKGDKMGDGMGGAWHVIME